MATKDDTVQTPPSTPANVTPLTRERFLARKPKIVTVVLSGGEAVKARGMTAGEQDWIGNATKTILDTKTERATFDHDAQIRARILSWCVLDYVTEKPLFSEQDIMDISAVNGYDVSLLAAVIQKMSNVEKEEVDKIVSVFPMTPAAI